MKQEYQLLHHDMLHDIERCLKLQYPEKENVERCFWIAKKYWERLKGLIQKRGFKDARQEIEFFREVKPQFTFYIEYFVILTEALQFVPAIQPVPSDVSEQAAKNAWKNANLQNITDYWENEGKRFKRFCDKHSEFIQYYENGERYNDSIYFLRENDVAKNLVIPSLYDNDTTYSTSHERLLRSYLANKKYWEYCKGRFVESRAFLLK